MNRGTNNKLKYIKYKLKFDVLQSCMQRRGNDMIQDLINIANSWIGKGQYCKENKFYFLNDIYATPSCIQNDFKILYADFYKIFDMEEYHFIKEISLKRLADRALYMNCWQFVFLCLMNTNFLTRETILKLYYKKHIEKNNADNSISNYFVSDRYPALPISAVKLGDIVMTYHIDNKTINHIGICTYIYENELSIIETLNSPVRSRILKIENFEGSCIDPVIMSYNINEYVKNLILPMDISYNDYHSMIPSKKCFIKTMFDVNGYMCEMVNVYKDKFFDDWLINHQNEDLINYIPDKEYLIEYLEQYVSPEKHSETIKNRLKRQVIQSNLNIIYASILQDYGFYDNFLNLL